MDGIVICLGRYRNARFKRFARSTDDPGLARRYMVIVNLNEGRSVPDTAKALGIAESTVRRIRGRFHKYDEAGLIDRREENGQRKLDEEYLSSLYASVAGSPQDYGYLRPTWTREMLVLVLKKKTQIKIHVSTMSRALRLIGARRGRPKPTVKCPWSDAAKRRRLRQIERLLNNLPRDEVAVYEDEVDIHLNPKIGLDWMVRGQQKEVLTPGQNKKRYLAGALDYRTRELTWVEGERKNGPLFIQLLWQLTQRYPKARTIHVILDNFSIHSTEQVRTSLKTPEGQRIKLHFLPPYCPDHNKIERTWQDLHANVTRNHTCPTLSKLMRNARRYLRSRNDRTRIDYCKAA